MSLKDPDPAVTDDPDPLLVPDHNTINGSQAGSDITQSYSSSISQK